MALAAMLVYIGIRFVAVGVLSRALTRSPRSGTHPAAMIAGCAVPDSCPCQARRSGFTNHSRCLVVHDPSDLGRKFGVVISVAGECGVKKSFGTALKFSGKQLRGGNNLGGGAARLACCYLSLGNDHGDFSTASQRSATGSLNATDPPAPIWRLMAPGSMYPQPGNFALSVRRSFSNPQFEAPDSRPALPCPIVACPIRTPAPSVAMPHRPLPHRSPGPGSPPTITGNPSRELAAQFATPVRIALPCPLNQGSLDDLQTPIKERGICKTGQTVSPTFSAVDWNHDGPR